MILLQVFNQYLEPGGEEVWVDTITSFSGQGFEVEDLRFLSSDWTRKNGPSLLKQAVRVWDNPESRAQLRTAVRRSKPNVLLYHNLIPVGSLGLYAEAQALNLPVVQYIHNFRPFSPSGTMWVKDKVNPAALHGNPWAEVIGRAWEGSFSRTLLLALYQQRLIKNNLLDVVKKWIAVSDFMRDRFIEAGLPKERVITLRHCWQPTAIPDPSRMKDHYLFLGRLVPEKGVMALIKAWQLLEKRLGNKCPRLVIAGSGPLEDQVHAIASKMNQLVCVGHVTGHAKDELLHGCRALIAPSIWWEPLGLIVYEAYDYGRPVLAARSGGLTETVQHEQTGFLHDAGNPEALADDVERMEEMGAAKRAEMGAAGRSWLIENASPKQWLESFTKILQNAAEASNR